MNKAAGHLLQKIRWAPSLRASTMNLTTISIAAGITRATSDSKHFVVDRERGVLVEEEMSLRRLEQFAREQGAIEPWEELERPFCTPPPPEDDDDEGAR